MKDVVCFGDFVVDFSINVGIVEECIIYVCEGFYCLKGLFIYCYLWFVVLVFWSWLKCYFRFFGVDGKIKVVVGWGKVIYFYLYFVVCIYGVVVSK